MVAARDFLTGTRPCIFSWRPADSYQVVAWWDSPIYLQVRCSGSFPVLASASSGDRTRETLQNLRPRPTGTQVQWPRSPPSVPTCPAQARARILLDGPRHADRFAVARARRLYEELSHQGHSKRWHCRPRRHREDATGVVVALHRGDDAALGKNCGRKHDHG